MKPRHFFVVVLAAASSLVLLAVTAPAQAPQGGFLDPSGSGIFTNATTIPLADSETLTLPIDVHVPTGGAPVPNWAGVRMKMHILDAGEVDVDFVRYLGVPVPGPAGTITDPFGPRSMNQQSAPITFTVLDPNWPNSGITLQPSVNQSVFDVGLHVKNTTPLNNGDIDLSFMFSNIYHVPDGPGSGILQLFPSWFLFVSSNIIDPLQLHTVASGFELPTNPVDPGTGHWLHFTDTATFHLNPGPGSALYATPGGGRATIGIEHIPEPSRAVLLVLGLSAICFGARAHRRRRMEDADAA